MTEEKENLGNNVFTPYIDWPVRLPIFEGPLDLLLFLIRKEEIDIYDIPVEKVTKQYIDILYSMKQMSLDVAGDFFVMAATLMHIKSRMLLPKNEQIQEVVTDEDETEDPRWRLVEQLLEYKKFKEAAVKLEEKMNSTSNRLPRIFKNDPADKIVRPLLNSDKLEIWTTFNNVLKRLAEKATVGHIHEEIITVSEKMELILEVLKSKNEFLFTSLFEEGPYSIIHVVTSFLAVLELTRLKKLIIDQHKDFDDIRCIGIPDSETLFNN